MISNSVFKQAIGEEFNESILDYIDAYSKNGEPIEVSFRKLVSNINNSDRATHLIHAYPAKLLMHIPYYFLHNTVFSKKGDKVLDPFCGSGTVLLESILAERNAIGTDANPLARLISKVKTTKYDIELLKKLTNDLKSAINNNCNSAPPNVINIDYWFLPRVKEQLTDIIEGINKISHESYRDFFLLCFSNCIKKVSLTDPRVSVPVRLKAEHYNLGHPLRKKTEEQLNALNSVDVKEKFFEITNNNIKRFEALSFQRDENFTANVIGSDAKNLQHEFRKETENFKLETNSIDLIISSPPYAGAQKYIRASSLNLGWLGHTSTNACLKKLEEQNIGREHYKKSEYSVLQKTGIMEADIILENIFEKNPLRSYIAANYLKEMKIAFSESVRVLKPEGYIILIAANNQVCGLEFKTQEFLMQIMKDLGMRVVLRLIDDIKSYGLMTKRNKTASIITREWVLIFQK